MQHIIAYDSGTSGWVETVTDKQVVDINCMIGAIVGAEKGKYNYFAEMETAGKCFEWVKDHLVLDEVNVYLQKQDVAKYLVRKDFHYFPNKVNKEIYDKNYAVFKKLYKANKENFALLNKLNGG